MQRELLGRAQEPCREAPPAPRPLFEPIGNVLSKARECGGAGHRLVGTSTHRAPRGEPRGEPTARQIDLGTARSISALQIDLGAATLGHAAATGHAARVARSGCLIIHARLLCPLRTAAAAAAAAAVLGRRDGVLGRVEDGRRMVTRIGGLNRLEMVRGEGMQAPKHLTVAAPHRAGDGAGGTLGGTDEARAIIKGDEQGRGRVGQRPGERFHRRHRAKDRVGLDDAHAPRALLFVHRRENELKRLSVTAAEAIGVKAPPLLEE